MRSAQQIEDYVYRLLPDYIREDDPPSPRVISYDEIAPTGTYSALAIAYPTYLSFDSVIFIDGPKPLASFLGAATRAAMGPALTLADIADPDTSATGFAEVADPTYAPRAWLRWLAYLIGIDVSALPVADQRQAVRDATALQRRGSAPAILRRARATLTGTKSARLYANITGSDPYVITLVTLSGETPDAVATGAAATQDKPAGVRLDVLVVAGAIYSEFDTAFSALNYSTLRTRFRTYADTRVWTP